MSTRSFGEKRAWQPREQQMVAEWLSKAYPQARTMTRVRLGAPKPAIPRPDLSPEELAMIGQWRRWADAVVLEQDRVILVEASIRPDPGKISQLELYALLFPQTPELAAWAKLPLTLMLLYAIEDPATIYLARQKGILCVQYRPDWLDDYLAILYPRERRGSQFAPP